MGLMGRVGRFGEWARTKDRMGDYPFPAANRMTFPPVASVCPAQ